MEGTNPKSDQPLPPGSRGLFLVSLEIMEQVYGVPVEEREALLIKLTKEKKAEYMGSTTKSIPEIATDCIKAGIKAKSYVMPEKKLDKKADI